MKKVFIDSSKIIKDNLLKIDEEKYNGYSITHFKVTTNNEKLLKKIKGDYYTISFDYISLQKRAKQIKKSLVKILKLFFKNENQPKPLIIGLGNSNITCDSLGVTTTNKMMSNNQYNNFLNSPNVVIFNPEVIDKSGISSFSLIEMVVKKLKPTVIIIIDTLVTNNEDNLNNHIEINNTGIIPGSELKENKKIDYKTFNIPVIAIGVPLIFEYHKNLYTTPSVTNVINLTSNIISEALNDIFF